MEAIFILLEKPLESGHIKVSASVHFSCKILQAFVSTTKNSLEVTWITFGYNLKTHYMECWFGYDVYVKWLGTWIAAT